MRILALLLCLMGTPASACSIALMFAIDTSGSINADEWDLQTSGLADALLEPEIAQIIVGQRAYLAAYQWSGETQQDFTIGWARMTDMAALLRFAGDVRALPRLWSDGNTAIGTAMEAMSAQFGPVAQCQRRVIDLSGDGVLNGGGPLPPAREALDRQGITLNGLAIEPRDRFEVDGFKSLDIYYRTNVIVGRGAFVQAADGYRDYPRAIRLKLLTELVQPLS